MPNRLVQMFSSISYEGKGCNIDEKHLFFITNPSVLCPYRFARPSERRS